MSVYQVTLGHAVHDERGKGTGGKAGDQTGGEVLFQPWYISGGKSWDVVLRATSKATRKKIADCAERIVRNDDWGYDMDQRYTGYDAVKLKGFNPDAVSGPVECDCSVMASVCAGYAGITVPRDTRTANMQARYMSTGRFDAYTAKAYVTKPDKLLRGDILVRAGHHTAIVVNTLYWLKSNLSRKTATLSRRADVKAVQQRLKDMQGEKLVVDGIWGNKTEDAVKRLQRSYALTDDGIIGKNTAAVMGFLFN